jgi:glycosyltransferase involved in cell wall biosynthesis
MSEQAIPISDLVWGLPGFTAPLHDQARYADKDNAAELSIPFFHTPLNQPTVSVIIPALNEAENLPHVLPKVPTWVHEVILVDGHSTDRTVAVAQELWPTIRIVTQQGRGKGAALRSGFTSATGDIIVMLDADGSTDPREIPAYVGALVAGADFAKGSRFLQGGGTADMPFYRKMGNWGFVLCVRMLFGGAYSDLCYGYNAFWRRVIPQLELDGDGFEIETMMNIRALRHKLKIAEVPSFEWPRVHGIGRLRTIPDGWRVLKTIVREWVQARQEQNTRSTVTTKGMYPGQAVLFGHNGKVEGEHLPK